MSAAAPQTLEAALVARRRDKLVGLVVLAGTFAVCTAISLWAKHESAPELAPPPDAPTTQGVAGFPRRVDPVQVLPRARELTQRELLRGFVADGVKSDGTLDFSGKGARLRYAFQSAPGRGPQPPREGGTLPVRTFCGRQNVHVNAEGLVADPDVATYPCSSRSEEPLPPPRCSLAQVWNVAKERGAPDDGLARVEYYRAKSGPSYRFSIAKSRHLFSLNADCKTVQKGKKAVGRVP